ncbi:MAG: hypothetical protein M1825_001899 [Sarcosagium campestre]|nr:MAG: hypothetical protein M1825_001899 [Sarcosagium campestre]
MNNLDPEHAVLQEPKIDPDNGHCDVTSNEYESKDEQGNSYPEGGLQAWKVVFGSFCGMLGAFGLANSIGTFQAYISENQLKEYTADQIGWIFSLYIFLAFFCGVQIGPVFDARGPRLLVLVGSINLVLTMMLLGLCSEYWHFMLVFGLLGGVGTSLIFTPAIASVGHYFLTGRGNATGIATTGGSIGGVVFPLMLQALIPRVGFAWATRIIGFIFIGLFAVANMLIRSRLVPERRASAMPDFSIFRSAVFSLTTAGVFLTEWGLFIPLSFISSYALAHGVDSAFSYQLLAILNAGSFFGRWAPGWLADRFGRFNLMIATVALCLVSTFGLWLPAGDSVALLVVYAVVFGFASGSNISLTPPCVGQLCKTVEYGRYYATLYTLVSFGTLTGLPIAGALITTENGSYKGLIIFTGACYAGGLVMFLAARILAVGWRFSAIY